MTLPRQRQDMGEARLEFATNAHSLSTTGEIRAWPCPAGNLTALPGHWPTIEQIQHSSLNHCASHLGLYNDAYFRRTFLMFFVATLQHEKHKGVLRYHLFIRTELLFNGHTIGFVSRFDQVLLTLKSEQQLLGREHFQNIKNTFSY